MEKQRASVDYKPEGYPPASDHRHGGARAAMELPGQLMGTGHEQIAELLHGLGAAADKDGEALVGREGIPCGCTTCEFTEAHIAG